MSNAQLFPVIVKLNYSGGWIPATTLTILSALFTDILCFAARPHFVSDNAPPPFPGGGGYLKKYFLFLQICVYIITNCVLFICFLVKICLIVKVVEILGFFFSTKNTLWAGSCP